jgi:hypothetical protein
MTEKKSDLLNKEKPTIFISLFYTQKQSLFPI